MVVSFVLKSLISFVRRMALKDIRKFHKTLSIREL